MCGYSSVYFQSFLLHHLAPGVQTLDSAIHRINHSPVDKYLRKQLHYPLDRFLSGGQRYPMFEEPGPGDCTCPQHQETTNISSPRLHNFTPLLWSWLIYGHIISNMFAANIVVGNTTYLIRSSFSFSISTVAKEWCLWISSGLRNIVPEPKKDCWKVTSTNYRGTQWEYSSKPLKHSIVKGILVFKRWI